MLFVSKKKDVFPRKILVILFFVLSCFLYGQTAPASGEPQSSVPFELEVQAQAQSRSGRETEESLILIDPPVDVSEGISGNSSNPRVYSSAGAALRLVVVLILLCVACYFIIRFLRKSPRTVVSDPFLKSVASLSLGQGKSVAVVTLGSRAFLLGIADQSVSLIAEITDNELIDQMNLDAGINSGRQKSFAEMLSELIPKSRQKNEASSAEKTVDFIRNRRSSLKNRGGDEE